MDFLDSSMSAPLAEDGHRHTAPQEEEEEESSPAVVRHHDRNSPAEGLDAVLPETEESPAPPLVVVSAAEDVQEAADDQRQPATRMAAEESSRHSAPVHEWELLDWDVVPPPPPPLPTSELPFTGDPLLIRPLDPTPRDGRTLTAPPPSEGVWDPTGVPPLAVSSAHKAVEEPTTFPYLTSSFFAQQVSAGGPVPLPDDAENGKERTGAEPAMGGVWAPPSFSAAVGDGSGTVAVLTRDSPPLSRQSEGLREHEGPHSAIPASGHPPSYALEEAIDPPTPHMDDAALRSSVGVASPATTTTSATEGPPVEMGHPKQRQTATPPSPRSTGSSDDVAEARRPTAHPPPTESAPPPRRRAPQYTFRFLHRLPTLNPLLSAAVVECLGTFFLVLSVPLSAMHDTELAPLAVGLMLLSMTISMAYVSGGHFNPAVSLAVWLCSDEEDQDEEGIPRHPHADGDAAASASPEESFSPYAHLSFQPFTVYLTAQLVGGCLAALYSFILFGSSIPVPSSDVIAGLSTTTTDGETIYERNGRETVVVAFRVLFAEALYTFLLCSVMLHVAVHQEKKPRIGQSGVRVAGPAESAELSWRELSRQTALPRPKGYAHPSQHFYGFAMGLAVVSAQLAIAPISGGALNPAVIAPLSIVRCALTWNADTCGLPLAWLGVYLPAELLGALIAAMAYVALHHHRNETDSKEEGVQRPTGQQDAARSLAGLGRGTR